MAFELATIEIKPAGVGTGIKVSLKKIRKGSAKLSITIASSIVKDLGWSKGDKIVVQIGTGEHHGLVRLQKNNSKGQVAFDVREAGRGGVYGSLSLGHQPAFVDRSEPARWCQWEKVETGEIEVVLPKWSDETARKPLSRAEVPARPVVAPRAVGTSVTSATMGDPAPGRSALDQRQSHTPTR